MNLIYSQLQNDGAETPFPRLLWAEVHTWQAAGLEMAMESHSPHRQAGTHSSTSSRVNSQGKVGAPPPPQQGTAPEQSLANAFTLGARKGCPRRKFLLRKASSALDTKIFCSTCPQSFAQEICYRCTCK